MLSRFDTNKMVRGLAYALEIFVLHILQTIPGFIPRIFTVTPLLSVAACMSIAILESELSGMLFGLETGLLLDVTSSAPFGTFSMFFLVIYAFLSAFSGRKIKIKLPYVMIASIPAMVVLFVSIWFVQVFVSQSGGYLDSFINRYLPMMVYSYFAVPFLYPLNAYIHKRLKNSAY